MRESQVPVCGQTTNFVGIECNRDVSTVSDWTAQTATVTYAPSKLGGKGVLWLGMICAACSVNKNDRWLRMSSAKRCSFCLESRLSSQPKQSLYKFPKMNPRTRNGGRKTPTTT